MGDRPGLSSMLKKASSISRVSSKLGVSRPTLYRYMWLYEEGDRSKLPDSARSFFDYCSGRDSLDEDDVSLYFLEQRPERPGWAEGGGMLMSGGDRAIVILRHPESDRSVEVAADISGETVVIGVYRARDDRSFVLIDDLVPGHEFKYRTVSTDGRRSGWEVFVIGGRGSSPDTRNPAGRPRRP